MFKKIFDNNEEFVKDVYIERSKLCSYNYTSNSLSKMIKNYSISNVDIVDGAVQEVSKNMRKIYKRVVILNFANGRNPGGGYTKGNCFAQEENLCCYFPTLYHSLVETEVYPFKSPKVICTKSIYMMRELETYKMLIEEDWDDFTIVSAVAPNRHSKNGKFVEQVVEETVINMLLAPVKKCGIKSPEDACIVLGAWGCGAFGNSPESIANIMKSVIKKFGGHYDKIVFAIPNSNRNYQIFKDIMVE